MSHEICRITVPCDLRWHTPNYQKGRHWRVIHHLRQNLLHAASWSWRAAGCPTAKVPVDVCFVIRKSGRRYDEDNAIASLKPLIDGLFKGRITPDDGPRFVRLTGVTQETSPAWKLRPEVEIRVTARDQVNEALK